MIGPNLSADAQVDLSSGATVAGVTAVTGTGFAMAGYESIMFVCFLGEVLDTATIALKAQSATDASATGAADITGATTGTFTADATSADNKVMILDVIKPNATFVHPVLTRGVANTVVVAIIAIRYGYKKTPVPQASAIKNVVAD